MDCFTYYVGIPFYLLRKFDVKWFLEMQKDFMYIIMKWWYYYAHVFFKAFWLIQITYFTQLKWIYDFTTIDWFALIY